MRSPRPGRPALARNDKTNPTRGATAAEISHVPTSRYRRNGDRLCLRRTGRARPGGGGGAPGGERGGAPAGGGSPGDCEAADGRTIAGTGGGVATGPSGGGGATHGRQSPARLGGRSRHCGGD